MRGITKTFGATPAVDGVSLDIKRGELFCLLGGSGCGKTPLLTLIPQTTFGHVKVPRKVALWDPLRVSIFSGRALATST